MKQYKKIFKESDEDFNGRKINGVVFSSKELEILLKEGLMDFILDTHPGGGFHALEIKEMHIYNPYDSIEGSRKLSDIIWPEAIVRGDKIILESSFGFGKEDQIICKKVRIEL